MSSGAGAIVAVVVAVAMPAAPSPTGELTLSGDISPAHDPVLIRAGKWYYSYSTGQRGRVPLLARRSRDLMHWRPLPSPLASIPTWAATAVSGARSMWAPDVSRSRGRFRLYYSVSKFGSQRSVIGLATAATLDPDAPGYGWRDEGMVVSSRDGASFNAIDPAFVRDRDSREWLAFGSFWSGLKIVELDPATGKPQRPDDEPIAIAHRAPGQEDAIEAPFVFERNGWYWLLASFDHCCRGAKSDYNVVVGRSRKVTGPYVDRAGNPMLAGGGTVLVQGDDAGRDRFRGPGHAGLLHDRGRDYLIHHAYDARRDGAPTLRIARLRWSADGWPTAIRNGEAE